MWKWRYLLDVPTCTISYVIVAHGQLVAGLVEVYNWRPDQHSSQEHVPAAEAASCRCPTRRT